MNQRTLRTSEGLSCLGFLLHSFGSRPASTVQGSPCSSEYLFAGNPKTDTRLWGPAKLANRAVLLDNVCLYRYPASV